MAEWKKIIVSGSVAELDRVIATSFTGSFKGNVAGSATSATDATNSTNIRITDTDTNTTYYPVFTNASTGNAGAYVDASTFTYNAATNTLTLSTVVANLTGNASTATTAATASYVAAGSITTGTISDDRLPATITSDITGNAATATTATSASRATSAASADAAATATTTTNISVAASSTNTAYPLVFVAGAAGDVRPYTDNTSLNFNPGTNTLGVSNISAGSITLSGDLTVNGSTTIVSTTNTEVEDRFMILNVGSGSVTPAGEGGIIIEGGTAGTGAAFFHDSTGRWSIASDVSKTATSVAPSGYMAAVYDTAASHTPVAAAGNIKVDSGDIYIYA